MSKLIWASIMLTCLTISSMAEVVPGALQLPDPDCLIALSAVSSPVPNFEAFHEKSVWNNKPAEVDLKSDPEASRFRTVLSEGAKRGPNFAGHYTIVGWGCGTSCLNLALVDAKSGKVNFLTALGVLSEMYVDPSADHDVGINDEFLGLRFRRDSSLLVVLGSTSGSGRGDGISFYQWTGVDLKLLTFVPRSEACRREH
ncbi:MAG: hypothetical protein P4L66_05140 [Acetobacteraceae bacterium]|nr:hypothetical protein [Acetobacteraceae bacterium]